MDSGAALQHGALDAARSLPGTDESYPFTPGLLVCKVAGRVFMIVTEDPAEPFITVKGEPPRVDALVHEHASAQPGRYLNKHHWVSIGPGASITRALIDDLVQDSYDLVVGKLSRDERDRLASNGVDQSSGGA